MNDKYKKEVDKLFEKTIDTIEKYGKVLPPFEVVYMYIKLAVDLAYMSAPSELLASKLIRQSVHDGIELYKERIEEGEEKND